MRSIEPIPLKFLRSMLFYIGLIIFSQASGAEAENPLANDYLSNLRAYGAGVAFALEGQGKRGSTSKIPNRFEPNSFDTVFTETYQGIEISWLQPGPKPQSKFLQTLSITNSKHPIAKRFGISRDTGDDIVNMYGEPSSRADNEIVYYAPDYVNDVKITFLLDNGKLIKIMWRWSE